MKHLPIPPFVTIWLQLAHRPARMWWRAFGGCRWNKISDECCGCSEYSSKLLTTAIVLIICKDDAVASMVSIHIPRILISTSVCRRNLTFFSGHIRLILQLVWQLLAARGRNNRLPDPFRLLSHQIRPGTSRELAIRN